MRLHNVTFHPSPAHVLFTDAALATEQQHSSAGTCIMTDPTLGLLQVSTAASWLPEVKCKLLFRALDGAGAI